MPESNEPPLPHAGRLVWNSLWSEFSTQTPSRMARREGTTDCPFCADLTQGRAAPESTAWIRPNEFPALTPPEGECFILIYSHDHDRRFADLSTEESLRVVALWREVYDRLSSRYACVMTWETNGAAIGQTQAHPHGQTYSVSVVPELLQRELESVVRAERKGLPCPFCAAIAAESAGPRCVYLSDWWVAFVPPWARYPYQTQIVPRTHFNAMDGLAPDSPAARDLAMLLPGMVRAYDAIMREPMPYMLALHQLADERFHFHIELLPVGRAPGKLKLAASGEMAFGLWVNETLPEVKAAELRTHFKLAARPEGAEALE